ncbi:hypothetical protein C2857_004089 [Epichloe festucae Fl1]|uniref:L-lactate dehydrogenase (cytochrome) n=1 Tax=Epichloe festucae (strain Fl1) TaxID=877507 RepID=A0A7U3Q1K7_EPIFF|nr:hypothetical protein C2857_004089 [Epichloe festucae Fl1]
MAYCLTCQRGFKHVQALRQHLETSSKHMHDCQRCDRSFGSECSREQHCRDSSKHHICEFDGCEVDFETEAALERHEDVAHPRCAECDDVVELDSLTELVHHRDGHHGDGHAARLVSSDELVMFTFSPSALCWAKEDTFVCAELGGGSGGGCRAACPSHPKSFLVLHTPSPTTMALKGGDIEQHNDAKSCWVIIHVFELPFSSFFNLVIAKNPLKGKAYDVTEFLPEHPGGSKIILKYAVSNMTLSGQLQFASHSHFILLQGKDATEEFEPIHPPDTLDKYLDKSKHLGHVDMDTVAKEVKEEDPEEAGRLERVDQKPLLSQCYNLLDFEAVARRVMKKTAWGYYSSAADDEITMRENHSAFHRIWFRPQVLVDVENVDLTTTMLGTKCSIPFYVTATALGKLGHPEGEVVLTRAAHTHDVIQMIPTMASCSLDEIVDARRGDQVQWLQLYVNKDREITRKIVQHAERRGCKGLFITVDAPQLGRREKDMRTKFTDKGSSVQSGQDTDTSQGAARAISSFIDPSLSWKDVPWFKSITKMPVILKGVQRVEDVLRAVHAGADGVVLSNHGGRQLDTARSGIEVLAETMPILRARGLQDRIEVFVDGGVRRATDMIKALCLGARGVGIGRPFLYAMGAYGQEGVERAMQLLKDEMEMDMRLIGCASVQDLNPSLVDAKGLFSHSNSTPVDALSHSVYDPLVPPAQRPKAKL